ncbi:MAG: hypothetical protein GEU90_11400 [Gemmatimonas sp.]|nr:hypothetical protein [Gemmatimonas sp.]
MRFFTSLTVLVLALSTSVPVASASRIQSDASTVLSATVALQDAPTDAAAAVQGSTGLPQRAPDPRTLEAYWPVFAVFALTWIAIVGYWLTFGRRVLRIADELGEIAEPDRE